MELISKATKWFLSIFELAHHITVGYLDGILPFQSTDEINTF